MATLRHRFSSCEQSYKGTKKYLLLRRNRHSLISIPFVRAAHPSGSEDVFLKLRTIASRFDSIQCVQIMIRNKEKCIGQEEH
jgi:hypothetical protein